ncbi:MULTISPECIES: hypothetical protein [Chitinophagaceae]
MKALGEVDFGIFNLVSGVVVMLSFLNNALANSTQRFLSFYQGKNDSEKQKAVFSNSWIIHVLLAVILIIILESFGAFLFNGFFKIPPHRITAAKYVFQFVCMDIFFTIISVPYNASLMAHENIAWIGLSNVLVAVLKLVVAFLIFNSSFDKLIFYGFLMACITITNYLFYMLYCVRKYKECKLFVNIKDFDKELTKKMASFAVWNLLSILSAMGRTQGIPIVLNQFYGTRANASYGVSYQISGQLNFFSSALLTAINPQIMKSEGENNRARMLRLSLFASKIGFVLLAIFVIPFMFEIKSILRIWLANVPEYTAPFCLFILAYFLLVQLTVGLDSAMQAIGDLKKYSIATGIVRMLTLPVGYLVLYMGYDFYVFFWCFLFFELCAGIMRVVMLKQKGGLEVNVYVYDVLVRLVLPVSTSIVSCFLITQYVPYSQWRFICTGAISGTCMVVAFITTSLSISEKELLTNFIQRFKNKIKRKNG